MMQVYANSSIETVFMSLVLSLNKVRPGPIIQLL